jgi:hypothetical protein
MADDKYKGVRDNVAKAEKHLQDLADELRKAKLAGIDVMATEAQYKDLLSKITLLKSVYGV